MKTQLTNKTEGLVAYNAIKRPLDAFAKRADRKIKPLAEDVYARVKKRQKMSEETCVVAYTRFETKDKARTLSEGIEVFKQKFPQYGEKLQEIIDETRKTKKRYLEFGLMPGCDLKEETYIAALRDIGVPEHAIERTYQTVMDLGKVLEEKQRTNLEQMLIK